jgi:DNA-binding response OmpR family regulator
VIRRKKSDGKKLLEFQNIKINMEERLVLINNQPVELNRKEFEILVFLMMNKNRIASKSAIAENIWGDYMDQSDDFDFIYSQIKNLRKKLRDCGAIVDIGAVYGMGYKLTARNN